MADDKQISKWAAKSAKALGITPEELLKMRWSTFLKLAAEKGLDVRWKPLPKPKRRPSKKT